MGERLWSLASRADTLVGKLRFVATLIDTFSIKSVLVRAMAIKSQTALEPMVPTQDWDIKTPPMSENFVADSSAYIHGADWFGDEAQWQSLKAFGLGGGDSGALCLDIADLIAFFPTETLSHQSIINRATELRFRKGLFALANLGPLMTLYRNMCKKLSIYCKSFTGLDELVPFFNPAKKQSFFAILVSAAFFRVSIAVIWPPKDPAATGESFLIHPAFNIPSSKTVSFRLWSFTDVVRGCMPFVTRPDHLVTLIESPADTTESKSLEDRFLAGDMLVEVEPARTRDDTPVNECSTRYKALATAMAKSVADPDLQPAFKDFAEEASRLGSYTDVEIDRSLLQCSNLEGGKFAVLETPHGYSYNAGVYATVDIANGQPLFTYAGVIREEEELDQAHIEDEDNNPKSFVIKIPYSTKVLDGFPLRKRFVKTRGRYFGPSDEPDLGIGLFANHLSTNANAKLVLMQRHEPPYDVFARFESTRPINKGDEVTWNYNSETHKKERERHAANAHELEEDLNMPNMRTGGPGEASDDDSVASKDSMFSELGIGVNFVGGPGPPGPVPHTHTRKCTHISSHSHT